MIQPTDTLTYDYQRITYWQSDSSFDYNRELLTTEVDLWGIISRWFFRLLRKIFGSEFAEEYTGFILILVFIIIAILIVWFVYKKRPELFTRTRRNKLLYEVHEDTIYGIDFDEQISQAEARSDYKEVVRLLYLQTLKFLSDESKIDWQVFKTPTEYIYEFKSDHNRPAFRELTGNFLRVRYGNFDADADTISSVRNSQKQIRKGGSNEN